MFMLLMTAVCGQTLPIEGPKPVEKIQTAYQEQPKQEAVKPPVIDKNTYASGIGIARTSGLPLVVFVGGPVRQVKGCITCYGDMDMFKVKEPCIYVSVDTKEGKELPATATDAEILKGIDIIINPWGPYNPWLRPYPPYGPWGPYYPGPIFRGPPSKDGERPAGGLDSNHDNHQWFVNPPAGFYRGGRGGRGGGC